MSSSTARSTTRLSTRTGSSSSASSASAAASSPLARTGSIPKQRGEKYFIVLKAKGPEGAPRHCLFIVLARHDQLEPFVKGFSTSCFNGTGFFAYKGLKYIADAETYACDAAAALYEGATPEDAKAALGALGPRRYIRIDDFASMLGRGENGALAAVKAAVALRNAVDISADDEPEPGPEGGAGSQTEDDDVKDEPPASPLTSTSPRRARAAAAVATVTPAGDGTRGIEHTDPAWPRAPGRLGSATTELSRMHAWIDDRGLTVVSGAGCSPAEAVTRRSGDHASEIDYVVVDAGRGVDVVSCATDGDDGGPLVAPRVAGSRTRSRARPVCPRASC